MTEEITPVRTYVLVAFGLIVLTLGTIATSYLPLNSTMHTIAALAFAAAKALLVVMFFMNVRHGGPVMKIVIIVAVFWFGILVMGVLDDYLTRTWLGVPGH
jgi:cytochrome c oxidase subunit IV